MSNVNIIPTFSCIVVSGVIGAPSSSTRYCAHWGAQHVSLIDPQRDVLIGWQIGPAGVRAKHERPGLSLSLGNDAMTTRPRDCSASSGTRAVMAGPRTRRSWSGAMDMHGIPVYIPVSGCRGDDDCRSEHLLLGPEAYIRPLPKLVGIEESAEHIRESRGADPLKLTLGRRRFGCQDGFYLRGAPKRPGPSFGAIPNTCLTPTDSTGIYCQSPRQE